MSSSSPTQRRYFFHALVLSCIPGHSPVVSTALARFYNLLMAMRNLRVTKWLAMVPVAGVCTQCNREFQVPVKSLSRVADAQQSLRTQFNEHTCDAQN